MPGNLSFDEESLFWRLRMGEGIPSRDWHKPTDRTQNWHEIKLSLDQKVKEVKTAALFQKVYPARPGLLGFLTKFLRNVKIAFFMAD